MNTFSKIWLVFAIGLSVCVLVACGGQAPSASKASSRAQINAGAIVPASQIRVAEYLRYYDQHIPEPTEGVLALDLRLGNEFVPLEGGPVWLQLGMQAKSAEQDMVAPLNLALVIDRSGSMKARDKMPYVKESLRIFLETLNPDDIVSIITYSTDAELLVPAQSVGDGSWIRAAIDRIEPQGYTNLHAGIMMGLGEVDKNFDIRRNNRVILLTDGIANEGVTDPIQIAADAKTYNDRGTYLSTIGLGLDYNDALLTELAYQGQGGYAFVDSAEEMERVFDEQVAGLKQRVASDLNVTLLPEPGVRLMGVTGAASVPPEGASIPLPPAGTGDTGVLLARLQVDASDETSDVYSVETTLRPLVTVKMSYFDEFAQKFVSKEQVVSIEVVEGIEAYDPTWDLEILRNVTIQETAEGMIAIDQLFQAGYYEEALEIAVELEGRLAQIAQLTEDPQMEEDVTLMQRYQQTLTDAIRQTSDDAPHLEFEQPTSALERPYRGRSTEAPTSTPPVPTVITR